MKNKTIFILVFVGSLQLSFITLTATAQTAAQKMHDLLTAFVESGEHNVNKVFGTEDEGQGEKRYYFTEVWTTDLSQVSNPVKLFPQHLSAFFKCFSDLSGEAIEVYSHDAKESDPMMSGVKITWAGKERNWLRSAEYVLLPDENVRLILFEEPNDQRRLFLMKWEQEVVYDSVINTDQIVTHGEIMEYHGYKPTNAPFVAPYQKKQDKSLPEVSIPITQTYDELIAKVKRTCEIFKHEGWNGQNAAAVVLHKLSSNYSDKLTKEQYYELLNHIQPLIDETDKKGIQQLLGYTCYMFYQKSDSYHQTDNAPEQGYVDDATVSTGQKTKMVQYNTTMMNPGKSVTLKVKGRAPVDATNVTLQRYPQFECIDQYPVKNGRFEFTLTLPKDEMMMLFTTGCNPEKQVVICAENKELTIDLTKETVKGSKQSELLSDSLPRLYTMISYWRVDSILQFIRSNRDNILSAYAIHYVYGELSLDELRPYLNENYAYYHHPLMAPTRQYVEGWEKRSPGKPCPDAELLDKDNMLHQLKEYMGCPTLIHFWDINRYSIDQIEQLRQLHEQYPALQIISIAINQYSKRWRENIEQYQMNWTNLLAPNGWAHPIIKSFGLCSLPEVVLVGIDGYIVDSPTNLEELKRILKEQFD